MNKLQPPNFNIKNVLTKHNELTRTKIPSPQIDELEAYERDYFMKGDSNELYKMLPSSAYSELIKLYKNNVSKEGRPLRAFYDKLKTSVDFNRCPYCGRVTTNITIDHFLPKSIYSQFSVTPINLVPSCSDCNKNKSDKAFIQRTDLLPHPYFNDYNQEEWLFAKVVQIPNAPFSICYECKPNESYEDYEINTINNHFTTFKLQEYFGNLAATEISRYFKKYSRISKDPNNNLQDIFREKSDFILEENKNDWQGVLYRTLADIDPNLYSTLFTFTP